VNNFNPKFKITNTMTDALTRIERVRGFLEAATLSHDWLTRMSERALLLEAHYTTHIEGTQLTLTQAEEIWNGKSLPDVSDDDSRELLNYRDAFDLVSTYLNDGLPITETLIREIHRNLVKGVRGESGHPGQYRSVQNYVVNGHTGNIVYTPPVPEDVPIMMEQLVKYLNEPSEIHPVLVAGIAQFQLVHIHPFVDGNGRTSRLLSTLYLYRNGYDIKRLFTISEYYDRNRNDFYDAIQSVRNNNMNFTPWLNYFTTGLATQLEETKIKGSAIIKADVLAKKHMLNARQTIALQHILETGRLTITDYEGLCPESNRRTLQRDIKALLNQQVLKECGVGSTDPTRYYKLKEL
jgi:Fic family protein